MSPERYRRISELFQQALELGPSEREVFLAANCGDDAELRRHVGALLALDSEGEILAAPPTPSFASEDLSGGSFGHYRAVRKLGEGGMGAVYLGEDVRLDRKVALKFLAPGLLNEPGARARFLREAKAAAALDHPNICTVYEVEEAQGRTFIAMAYLEGHTVAETLALGPLELSEALDIALQTARGLEAAHEKGVVHRDIKPANLMVLDSGLVKIMDFGAARVAGAAELTRAGLTVGTISYMAPEQTERSEVDRRADLWSLGVVLYQMIAGRLPFDRPSRQAVLTAIAGAQPEPLAATRADVPTGLDAIVGKALEKDPDRRYQHARELAADLEILCGQTKTGQPAVAVRSTAEAPVAGWRPTRLMWAAAAVLAALGALVFVITRLAGLRSTPGPAALTPVPFTSYVGNEQEPAISPDGKQIAFTSDRGRGAGRAANLYVQIIGSSTPLRLTRDPHDEFSPTWSPDGTRIAFLREGPETGRVLVISALGGPETELGQFRAAGLPRGLAWHPDGKLLAMVDSAGHRRVDSIFLLSVQDYTKRQVTFPPAGDYDCCPAFDPDGRRLAFIRQSESGNSEILVMPAEGGKPQTFKTQAFSGESWTADGRALVFPAPPRQQGAALWRMSLPDGHMSRLGVGVENAYYPAIRAGRLAYTIRRFNVNIWQIRLPASAGELPSAAARPTEFITSTQRQVAPEFSPDGKRVVFVSDRSGSPEIWTSDRDGKNLLRLTSIGGALTGTPRWSPDSRWVAFDSKLEGRRNIYVASAGGGVPRRVTTGTSNNYVPSWSGDGRWIYFDSDRTGEPQIWKIRLTGEKPVQVTHGGGFEGFESADGKYFYYAKGVQRLGIWRIRLRDHYEEPVPELADAGYYRYWALTPDGVYFVPGDFSPTATSSATIRFFRFATRKTTEVATIGRLLPWNPGLTVSPDGHSLLYAQVDEDDRDIMLVNDFQ
jgi:Tol biopolymer transport system component